MIGYVPKKLLNASSIKSNNIAYGVVESDIEDDSYQSF